MRETMRFSVVNCRMLLFVVMACCLEACGPVIANSPSRCPGLSSNVSETCGCHPRDVVFINRVEGLNLGELIVDEVKSCMKSEFSATVAGKNLFATSFKPCLEHSKIILPEVRQRVLQELDKVERESANRVQETAFWRTCYAKQTGISTAELFLNDQIKSLSEEKNQLSAKLIQQVRDVDTLNRSIASITTEKQKLTQERDECLRDKCSSGFAGRWKRVDPADGFIFDFQQNRCRVDGRSMFESSGKNAHLINMTISGNEAIGWMKRIYNNCTIYLAVKYTIKDSETIIEEAEGAGCDLPDYFHEKSTFKRQ